MSIRLESASIALVSTAMPMTSSMLTAVGVSSGSSAWSRDSSMICCTRRVSRSLSVSIRPANRLTASGSSLASDTASASSLIAPTGRLQLVADVGDEVAAYGLDPALAGAVLDQGQHQVRAQRRDPGGDVPGRARRGGP